MEGYAMALFVFGVRGLGVLCGEFLLDGGRHRLVVGQFD
jgi:hypothetical protein